MLTSKEGKSASVDRERANPNAASQRTEDTRNQRSTNLTKSERKRRRNTRKNVSTVSLRNEINAVTVRRTPSIRRETESSKKATEKTNTTAKISKPMAKPMH